MDHGGGVGCEQGYIRGPVFKLYEQSKRPEPKVLLEA